MVQNWGRGGGGVPVEPLSHSYATDVRLREFITTSIMGRGGQMGDDFGQCLHVGSNPRAKMVW